MLDGGRQPAVVHPVGRYCWLVRLKDARGEVYILFIYTVKLPTSCELAEAL